MDTSYFPSRFFSSTHFRPQGFKGRLGGFERNVGFPFKSSRVASTSLTTSSGKISFNTCLSDFCRLDFFFIGA